MILSTPYILASFPHVFNNEFNERKILHKAGDEHWGRTVSYHFVTGGSFIGTTWYMNKAKRLEALSRTLLLTEDKNGEIELFAFWQDFTTNELGYSQIHKQSLFIPRFCNRIENKIV